MSQQIQISGGAKVRDLQDVIIGTSGVLSSLAFDVANGVPKLDSNGKILVSQLPNSVMEYKGTWSAATNTPTLADGTGNQGDVYLCNVAGTVDFGAGPIAFFVGDQVIYSGSIWQRASGATGTVTSVAVTESGDSLNITGSPITTSGTINIGFNGTNLQYVNGAGNLTTFPILTGYVTAVSGTAPVVSSGGTTPAISMAAATALVDGYLLATDFAIFSAKQSALTFSSPLVNTSGTISIPAATTSVNGYLASADFTTFNNKQNTITLTTTGTSGASTLVGATLNIPNYGSALTGYVPYTGATANVDLGVYDLTADLITGATGSFASNGGSDTFAINHSSGSGIALNITKGGNGEGLYINKTSGTGNAATIVGTLEATTLVKSGGTSSQFLKADGTVDSNTYALDSSVVHNTGNETVGGTKTFSDATKNNGGIFLQNASSNSLAGYMNLGGLTNGVKFTSGGGVSNTFTLPSATGYDYTFPNGTGTIALTSNLSSYVPYTGAIANVDLGLYEISAQNAFLNGVSGINGGNLFLRQDIDFGQSAGYTTLYSSGKNLGFVSYVGSFTYNALFSLNSLTNNTARIYTLPNATGTIALTSDLTDYVTLSTAQTISGTKTFTSFTKNDFGVLLNASGNYTAASGYNGFGGISNGIRVVIGQTAIHDLVFSASTNYTYTFPSATGTIALVGGSGVGTVTSVAALTIGTTGTDLSSSVANSTTTPVITLNVPTASATNRGALSSADWTTFNNKQSALTNPVTGTGTTNYLPKFTGASTIGNSAVFESSGNVSIGSNSPSSLALTIQRDGAQLRIRNSQDSGRYRGDIVMTTAFLNINSYNDVAGSYMPIRIDASTTVLGLEGNVLIGTTTDAGYKLDVNGNTRISSSNGIQTIFGGATSFVINSIKGGLTAGNAVAYLMGLENSLNNQMTMLFNYAGYGSTSNYLGLGFYGQDNLFKLYATGAATFSSSVTADSLLVNRAVSRNMLGISSTSLPTSGDEEGVAVIKTNSTLWQLSTVGYAADSKGVRFYNNGGSGYTAFEVAQGGGTRFMVNGLGNVLIGTTDDGGRLVSYSTTAATQIKAAGTAPAITFSNTVLSPTYGGVLGTCTSANQFLTGTSAGDMVLANQFSGYRVYVASYSGGVYLTSGATSWTANSDIRLKNINSHIENAVEKLSTLQTINFSYKDDKTNKQNLGLIAQEVEKIFPELIDKNGDGMLGVRYTELVPVLIKAIQEQQKEINELKLKIK